MRAFVPPFRFGSFFSPEDTLLCAIAAESALAMARSQQGANARLNVVELTSGSGLAGFHVLHLDPLASLTGFDVDREAVRIAGSNATVLGMQSRARFREGDLLRASIGADLRLAAPDILICNPPYVPEMSGKPNALEADAGPDGTAHLRRAIELAEDARPCVFALSWCSLSDPAAVLRAAHERGYAAASLFVAVIADGEYSGSAHEYLRSLSGAFISETPETLRIIAPDGAARFAYLLMSAAFVRRTNIDASDDVASFVEDACLGFRQSGLNALVHREAPIPFRVWMLDRWDEVALRVLLHGNSISRARSS